MSKYEIAENYRQIFRASEIIEINLKGKAVREYLCGVIKLMDMTQFITSRELKQLLSMKSVRNTFSYIILLSLGP